MRKDYQLEKRKYVIGGFIVLIIVIFMVKLFSLQVMDSNYKQFADSNAFMRKTIYPSRDRNDKLVVYNQPAYDVMMIPKNVQEFDTIDFCRTLNITKEQFLKRVADMKDKRLNPGYSAYSPQKFITHISAQDYGRLQEKLYRFPGFFIQQRILRQYMYAGAANVLGNIREVNAKDVERDDYYAAGDYCGDLGVERATKSICAAKKGWKFLSVTLTAESKENTKTVRMTFLR